MKELHGDETYKLNQDKLLMESKVQDLQHNQSILESQLVSLHQDHKDYIAEVRQKHKQELDNLISQYDAIISQNRTQITEV